MAGKKGGRPRKYQSLEEFQRMIDEYFRRCDESGEPYTVTGLALALGTTRETLMDIQGQVSASYPSEFGDALKKAKLRVQNFAERRLYTNQPTGAIFALKNFGWRDRHETEISGPGGGPIAYQEISRLPDEELEKRISEMIERMK